MQRTKQNSVQILSLCFLAHFDVFKDYSFPLSKRDSLGPQCPEHKCINPQYLGTFVINRPGVAGAVLKTPLSFIHF